MMHLRCHLASVETLFGWTSGGEVPRRIEASCVASIISMTTINDKDMRLEALGIVGIREKAETITKE
jgi:hypothetical protein